MQKTVINNENRNLSEMILKGRGHIGNGQDHLFKGQCHMAKIQGRLIICQSHRVKDHS